MQHFFDFIAQHKWLWLLPMVGQFGFDWGDLGNTLAGFFDNILAVLVQLIQFIWQVLVAVANYIFAVLQFIWNFLAQLLTDLLKAFKWIWTNIIKAGLVKVLEWFAKLRIWLQRIFGPVLQWIKKIRAWYDKFFRLYVRPFLNLIRHIRQVLAIFRILGFKWAKKLDADLARIEQEVAKVFTDIRKYLNLAITWIGIIIDPLGLLRRNPLFGALIRSAPELQNLLYQVTQRPLSTGEADSANQDAKRYTKETMATNQTQYYSQGQVPPCIEESRQRFLVELAAIQSGSEATSV